MRGLPMQRGAIPPFPLQSCLQKLNEILKRNLLIHLITLPPVKTDFGPDKEWPQLESKRNNSLFYGFEL